jgi:hypothetical protein
MRQHVSRLSAFACVVTWALLIAAQEPPKGEKAAAKASVSGTFKGNGKEAKIAFVSAQWREPFNDKPGIRLIFTEMDHTRDPKADFNANFGRYGSALVISLFEDGGIFGCEVSHTALKGGFSALGKIKIKDFKFEGGLVQGQLTTSGPDNVFGQTWEVDLKFAAPLAGSAQQPAPSPAAAKTAKEPPAITGRTSGNSPPTREAPARVEPALPALNAKELPISQDATDVEYKKLVQHIGYNSPSDYKTVAADLVKKLTAQSWKIDGADRVAAKPKIPLKSYILSCTRGEATLTIFVKPAETGSQVTIFSKGLLWTEQ